MRVIITETTWAEKNGVPIEGSRKEHETVRDHPVVKVPTIVTGWDHPHPDPERARKGQREQTRMYVKIEGWVEEDDLPDLSESPLVPPKG